MSKHLLISLVLTVIGLLGCGKQQRQHREAIEKSYQGDFSSAASIYRSILKSDPGNPFFLNNLGWALFRDGEVEAADRCLRQARASCRRSSLEAAIATNLQMVKTFRDAKALMEDAKSQAAMFQFDRLLQEYGARELATKYKALCLERLGRREDAIRLREALARRPKRSAFVTHYSSWRDGG